MQLKLKTSKNAICCKMQHLEEQVSRLISCTMAECDNQNMSLSTFDALLRDYKQARCIGNRTSVKALRKQILASVSFQENVCSTMHATLREAIAARDSLIFWRDTYWMVSEAGNSSATSSRS